MNFYFISCFPRRHGKIRDSDEENDPDDEDAIANAVGCLGPFSGLLAPELQKYQKQIKGKKVALYLDYHNVLVRYSTGVIIVSYKCHCFLNWLPLLKVFIKSVFSVTLSFSGISLCYVLHA